MHSVYGFMQECTQKYDKDMYDAFNRVFGQLPIATVVNEKVLVLHGGIDEKVTIEKLNAAPRSQYVVNATNYAMPGKKVLIHPMQREKIAGIIKQQELMWPINAALWNDPVNMDGEGFNKERGTGMLFGPDVCAAFLEKEGFEMLIRSHEPAHNGYGTPPDADHACVPRPRACAEAARVCRGVPAHLHPPSLALAQTGHTAKATCA